MYSRQLLTAIIAVAGTSLSRPLKTAFIKLARWLSRSEFKRSKNLWKISRFKIKSMGSYRSIPA
jgi:hypothetical protein